MKHLKLFFALFAMLALGVGNAWGAEVTINFGSGSGDVNVNEFNISTTDTYGTTWSISTVATDKSFTPNADYSQIGASKKPATTITLTGTIVKACTINSISSKWGGFSGTAGNIEISVNGSSYATGKLNAANDVTVGATNDIIVAAGDKIVITVTNIAKGVKLYSLSYTYTQSTGGGETPEPDPNPTPDPEPDPTPGTGGTVTYTVSSVTEVTTTGNVPQGSTAVLSGTGSLLSGFIQCSNGKNHTLTLTGYEGYMITGVTIHVKSNSSKGTGSFSVMAGSTTIASITESAFNTSSWNGSWNTTGVDKTLTMTNDSYEIQSGENVTLTISCKSGGSAYNSLYVKSYTITYKPVTSSGGGTEEPAASLIANPTSLDFGSVANESSNEKSLTVSGQNLTEDVTLSIDGTYKAFFSVAPTTITKADEISQEIVVTYTPTTEGSHTGTLIIKSGEITKNVTLSGKSFVLTGAGTEEKPYTTTDIITLALEDKTKAWVEGYIIGVMENNKLVANTTSTNSNIVLADAADEKENYVPVALPSGDIRTALNLKDNSSNLGKKVAVYGTLEKYFSRSGVKEVSAYKWIVEEGELAAPTITPAGGTYYAAQNVSISAEEGTTIYYTLDGTSPTTESTVYSTPISIAETATLKAIAVKGEKTSPVASENYTINLPLTTMDAIFAKATAVGNTATSVQVVMNKWVITGVKGSNAYLTDGTKGLIIYTTSHGFEVGDVLSGTVECKLKLFNGSSELIELTSATTGLTVKEGGVVTPVELDATGIAALSGVNTGSVIKINGVATAKDVVAGVKLYNTLFSFADLTETQEYNVTGVYMQYNDTKEILPRDEADIEKVVGLPTVIIDVADITMEVGEEKTISVSTNPADAQVTYTIKSGTCVTLDGSTIKAESEGTATITALVAEKAGEYKGATKDFTVTVKTPEQALTEWVLTPLADITTNDLVVITMTKGETTWAMTNDKGTTAAPVASVVTLSADALAAEPEANLKWVVSNDNGTLTIYPYGTYETWLYCTNTNNGVRVGKGEAKEFTINANYLYTSQTTDPRHIGVYETNKDWRCYKPSSGAIAKNIADQTLAFYVKKNANDVLPGTGEDPEEPGDDPVVPTPTVNPTATFIFNTAEGLNDLGITYPATADEDTEGAYKTDFEDDASYTQDGITMTTTNGGTPTRVWLTATGKLDLRVYKGATLTFSVPAEHQISTIVFDGSNIGHLLVNGTAVSGNAWTGSEQTITFTAKADASTIKINTIAFVVEYTRNVTNKYGTICLPYASASTSGAYFYKVAGKETGKVYLESVDALEAGVPYIFEATASQITVVYTGDPVVAPVNEDANGLVGTFTDNTVVAVGNYILYNNQFCYAEAICYVNANRAYLVMENINGGAPQQMPGRRYIGMSVQGENEATGFENITNGENTTIKVIENGQLVIIRNGEKFNAQGQRL